MYRMPSDFEYEDLNKYENLNMIILITHGRTLPSITDNELHTLELLQITTGPRNVFIIRHAQLDHDIDQSENFDENWPSRFSVHASTKPDNQIPTTAFTGSDVTSPGQIMTAPYINYPK